MIEAGKDRRWTAACLALGAVSAAISLVGAGRQLAYDEAVSFGYFVATPSPFDVFGRSSYLGVPMAVIATNNHPLFNFLEHLLYSATGARAEWAYRVLPALCGAACVVLVGVLLRPRFGRLAALAGALFLAANPLLDDESHAMRGYTLFLLLVLLALVALGRRHGPLFAAALALALVTHLYLVLAVPGLLVLAWRWARLRWAAPWAAGGGVVGALPYAGLAADLARHSRDQGQIFRPDFPLQMVAYLVGAPWIYVVALVFPVVLLGVVAARREPAVWVLLATYTALGAGVWLIARPAELYPRFFFFLLPGAAWLVAAGVCRWPVLAGVAGLAVAASVAAQAPGWTEDQLATRSAAAVLDSRPGGCVISHDELVLAAYTRSYRVVTDPGELDSCPYLVVVTWELLPPVAEAAARDFPARRVLPAAYPGLVLTR